MPDENPLKDLAEGFGKGIATGTLEWTKEQVIAIAQFLNKDRAKLYNEFSLAIQLIKIERNSSEWKLYALYVKDKQLRKLVNMGLQLRLNSHDKDKLDKLRGKIRKKFYLDGLHIAEFVSSKVLSKFILSNVDVEKTAEELQKQVEDILKSIERDVTFVHAETKRKNCVDKVVNKINVLSPQLHILTSKGSAVSRCKTITSDLHNIIKDNYNLEEYGFEDEYVVFFKKKPINSN